MYLRDLIEHTNLITWILIGLFILSAVIQLAYFLFTYSALITFKPGKRNPKKYPVSVIICTRNEAENLRKFLPRVLEQDYPQFEVIVVNDGSTDDTDIILGELASRYEKLRITAIPVNEKFRHGKKLAVTVGIKAAIYDHLIFTDADCYPVGKDWIKTMTGRFTKKKSIVLGYGPYERHKGLLNRLIRYETFFTAMQYLSMAIKGNPYMGVGRNMAYHKNLFFANKGFASHYHLQSGDDDLFINEVANKNNTTVEFVRDSQTVSVPERRFRDWFRQKQRHLKSGSHYKRSSKFRIGAEMASRTLFYGLLLTLCLISDWLWIALVIYLLILICKSVVFYLSMVRLNEKNLLLPSLIFDPVMPLILASVKISGLFISNNQRWK
jgi:cellulose synthase/poly-beta-1,6-N-acetylglucosamine synthase-like glycosyltransferase